MKLSDKNYFKIHFSLAIIIGTVIAFSKSSVHELTALTLFVNWFLGLLYAVPFIFLIDAIIDEIGRVLNGR